MEESAEIARPDLGYSLDLYDVLPREIERLRGVIERCRAHIVSQQAYLAQCEQELSGAESTLTWMLEHQAEEIAALNEERARKRALMTCDRHQRLLCGWCRNIVKAGGRPAREGEGE